MGGRAHHSRGFGYCQTSSFYLKRTYEKARTFEVACSKWLFLPYAALSLFSWKMATLQKFLSNLNMGIISVPDVYIILAPKNPHFFSWTIIYFWNYEKFWKYSWAWWWCHVFNKNFDYVRSSLFQRYLQKLQRSIYWRNFRDMEKWRLLSVGQI